MLELKDVAGTIYAPLITSQLDQERVRRSSIEPEPPRSRVLWALLLALFTGFLILKKGNYFHIPVETVVPIIGGYLLFLATKREGLSAPDRGPFHRANMRWVAAIGVRV